jgi:sodium/proline symporter
MLTTWVLIVFLAYFAALIGIAVFRSRQMQEMSDYVLAGRRVGSFTSALSSSSSATSGWTMLVFPALAFMHGAVEFWTVFGIILGVWLSWTFLAKRLRRYTIVTENSLTFPEFFERRFGDKWGVLRTLAVVIALFFIIFYISSGLIAGSKLLNTVFGLDSTVGVLVTLVAVASYTFIGGFLAVSRTDVFQAIIMLAGFFILPLTLILLTSDPFQALEGTAAGFWNPLTDAAGEGITVTFLLSAAGWGLGSFGSLRVLQRFMAVESEKHIRPSRNIATLWITLIFSLGLLLGLVAVPALGETGRLAEVTADPERLYLVAATVFFPPIIAGVLLSAVIAAVMSTADSQLLLASAMATDDLPLIKRYAYAKRYVYVLGAFARVWLGRFLLVVVGVVAALLSIFNPDSVFNLVSYAWGGMGAAFGPLILLALYWRRFNFWGALTSMLTGTVVASIWGYFSGGPGGIMDIQPATPGFIIAIPIAVAVTLLTAEPSEEITEVFDDVTSGWSEARRV